MYYLGREERRAATSRERTKQEFGDLVEYAHETIETLALALDTLTGTRIEFRAIDKTEAANSLVLRYAAPSWSLVKVMVDLTLGAYYAETETLMRLLGEYEAKCMFYCEFPDEASAFIGRKLKREVPVKQMCDQLWDKEHGYGTMHKYAHADPRAFLFHARGLSKEGSPVFSAVPKYNRVLAKMQLVEIIRALLLINTALADVFADERAANPEWEDVYTKITNPARSDPIWDMEFTPEEIETARRDIAWNE